jgi:hypothetical protein
MGTPKLSRELAQQAIDMVRKCAAEGFIIGGSPSAFEEAAKRLKISSGGITTRLRRGEQLYGLTLTQTMLPSQAPEVELPVFPDEDAPIGDVIALMSKRFKQRQISHDAHTWFPVKVNDRKPIGILFVGDPHVDDNGCNWPVLEEHARICRETAGLYAVNIGDSMNSWGGRLIRKYADQDTSRKTARRLAEWLLLDSGMKWLVWLAGNHEHMDDSFPLLVQMSKRFKTQQVVMHDWEARFVLTFPGGQEFRIFAAHDFPGNSMWNPLHGQVKAAMFGNNIDVAVCGHKHNYAVSQWELPEQGNAPLMLRVRGYKHMDDFARRIGKQEQEEGQSILVVFDPGAKTKAGRVQAFVDVEQGAGYLSWLRGRS